MKIGELKQVDGGAWRGQFRTLNAGARIELEAVPTKRDPNSPDYIVHAVVDGGELVAFGNAWAKESHKEGRNVRFLSITMDDPSWPAPLNIAAFPVDGRPGTLEIVWNRPRQDRRAAA